MFSYTVGFFLFFFNLFSFVEIQIDLSDLKVSIIQYLFQVTLNTFITCQSITTIHLPGSFRALNCGSLLPSPQPSATLLPSISVILIISKYVSWAFMMSYKMPHCVYVQVSKETRNQLIGKHFIRIVLLY